MGSPTGRRILGSARGLARLVRSVLLVGVLVAGLVGGVAACSGTPSGGSSGSTFQLQHLDAVAFAAEVATEGVVVIDVRTPAEYATGHLRDAINVDVQGSDFAARLADLDVSTSYAVYCQSGHRSELALEKFAAAGFTHVVDLTGGVPAWTAQGYPLVGAP